MFISDYFLNAKIQKYTILLIVNDNKKTKAYSHIP